VFWPNVVAAFLCKHRSHNHKLLSWLVRTLLRLGKSPLLRFEAFYFSFKPCFSYSCCLYQALPEESDGKPSVEDTEKGEIQHFPASGGTSPVFSVGPPQGNHLEGDSPGALDVGKEVEAAATWDDSESFNTADGRPGNLIPVPAVPPPPVVGES
jgi:hypothetical protein